MSFFKKIGKAIGGAAKTVGSVTGKILKTASPVAALIPGVGPTVSGAAATLGEVLSPTKQEDIVNAVFRDGEVKLDKIEETILNSNPSISVDKLTDATSAMTDVAVNYVPTAVINDNGSLTTVNPFVKAYQWIKSNIVLVGSISIGLILYFSNTKKSYRRKRW